MERRQFLKGSAGLGVLAGLGPSALGERSGENTIKKQGPIANEEQAGRIGRPVRVVSIGFKKARPLKEIAGLVDMAGVQGADLIALPEYMGGDPVLMQGTEEALNGSTVTAMADLATKHQTYIVCPIDRKDGDRRFNSAVLLDRKGQVVCIYNKVFPWTPEYHLRPPIEPGKDAPVHQADFGRVGFATCYDINFPEVWQRLADQEAELVIWPSAYSGGAQLQAHALNHNFYIVSSTHKPDCEVYDITGERLLYNQGTDTNVSRITLDLDRGIYGTDHNNLKKRDELLRDHAEDIVQEQWMGREEWFVLRAKRPGISARKLARDYGMVELPQLIARTRLEIDKLRGWEFAKKVWVEPTVG